MTIKWVKTDPLVMNGEPFCYGTRLTVRNLLEMRASTASRRRRCWPSTPSCAASASPRPSATRTEHPERYAGLLRGRTDPCRGRASRPADAAGLPDHLRAVPGMVEASVTAEVAASTV